MMQMSAAKDKRDDSDGGMTVGWIIPGSIGPFCVTPDYINTFPLKLVVGNRLSSALTFSSIMIF